MISTARVVVVGAAPPSGAPGDDTALVGTLAGAGVTVDSRAFVDPDEAVVERALSGDGLTVVVAAGGGTAGDSVRRAVARATGARLVLNDRMLAALEEAHRRHDRALPRSGERLALLPQGAIVWRMDDAEPAWVAERERGAIVVVPRGAAGSPALCRQLVEFVTAHQAGRGASATRVLRTAGVSVAEVEERLAEWLAADTGSRDVAVAALAADGEAWVRLRARASTPEAAATALAQLEAAVAARLGDDVYGRDAESLEQVIGRRLRERALSVSVAESCTGGLLGHRLTGVPGSSAWFERGVIVYSNRAKEELLRVPPSVIAEHGAVSGPCAEAMARGICAASGSPCGVAITGIAGPDGGTPAKPVGTVFIGVAVSDVVTTRRFRFAGDRAAVKWQSSQMALDMLRRALGGAPP